MVFQVWYGMATCGNYIRQEPYGIHARRRSMLRYFHLHTISGNRGTKAGDLNYLAPYFYLSRQIRCALGIITRNGRACQYVAHN
ncbi:MAG: hypothetical protein JWO59_1503 [Chloroflexi bacterium]|nr:hypothetical protein [Chloroflexota bacterium]